MEAKLISDILLTIGRRPDVRLWRSQPLAARDSSGRIIRALPRGHPDLCGFLRPSGRMLMIEAKSPTGKSSKEQDAWARVLTEGGVLYVLAMSVQDVIAALEGGVE